ncbi:MAG: pyridoxal-phosphate dependent enzyme, partial [Actinomycetes bacterium]
PAAHVASTGPEIWEPTAGTVTHVVSAMGTTGTITGASRSLKALSDAVRIVGVQPAPGSQIPGIRAWSPQYLPAIFDPSTVDEIRTVTRERAVEVTRALAREEGLLLGMSSGGAAAIALDLTAEDPDATVVFIAPDRGDRYLSTDLFD